MEPDVLLLDEPTNHLDLQTRDALSLALQDYDGALVVVSHDRYLLRTVADDLWLVADGVARPFDGDLDDYRRWLSEHRQARERDVTAEAIGTADASRKQQRRGGADRRRQLKPLQSAVDKAEQAMQAGIVARQALEEKLADPGLYDAVAKDRLQALLNERASIEQAISEAEQRWLEAMEALEAAVEY